jgi:hypothetical protein
LPWPELVWPPLRNAAMRHGRRRAHSGEPLGQSVTPFGAARRAERAGTHSSAVGLATGEIRPAGVPPLPYATDRWDRGARCQLLSCALGAQSGVRIAYWVGWVFDFKK